MTHDDWTAETSTPSPEVPNTDPKFSQGDGDHAGSGENGAPGGDSIGLPVSSQPSGPPVESQLHTPPPVMMAATAPPYAPAEATSFWKEAGSFLRDLTFSVLIAVLVIVFVVQPVRVEGTSMLPRLHDGERIFVNKFVYRFEKIERGDIVVFWWPNDPSKSFIKRVIGLPGETVSVRDGVVYINGEPFDERYLDGIYHRRHDHMQPVFVKDHHFFVMGDNRDASNDSRVWGLVPEKYIYGKAMFRYWPLESVGAVH